ncbi:MAG: hypothetical protein ISS49_10745 [Anaerolineae bacterium]|nr:hypothetical protein [Anaerolineae bacterium]
MRAIETTGMIDEERQLRLDTPLPVVGPSRVRIIVLFPEEEYEEISESEWLRAAATSPAFDFLREPEEDIYTLADGRPFDDKG